MIRKLVFSALTLAALAAPALADWTGKDASGSTITFKNNTGACTSVICVPIAALTDAAGASLYGTAGTANANILTVQGIASMTPFLTNPSSATAPVVTMNSASANSGINSATAFVFDDVAPTSITENSFGFGRMSANRNQYTTIRDAAGNERGVNVTAANALSTDTSSVAGTTTLTGNGVTGAGSQRVTIASDNTAFSVNATVTQATSSNLKAQVDPLTAASWGIGTSTQNSTSATNGQLALGQFNTTPTTITTGNMSPLQMDNAGNLLVNIKTGASSGAVSQGSTTSGQTGLLVQGAVTTAAPTYTTAQTNPLSLDTSGNLRVNVTNTNANGSATSANSSPVVIASDQAAVAVKAASGAYASGSIASGAFASGAVASGAYASGSMAAGSQVDVTNQQTPVAAGAATATKATLLGGQFDTTQKTLTNGQQAALSASPRGALYVAVGADGFALTANQSMNVAQVNGVTTQTGIGASGTGSQRVAVSNDSQIKLWDGTTNTTVKAASTAPVATDTSLVTALNPNSPGIITLGQTTKSASVPMTLASDQALASPSSTVLGSYCMAASSGTMAAGLAGASPVFTLRYGGANLALIRNFVLTAGDTSTVFTAGVATFNLFAARSYTVSATGGTASTITGNNGKLRTSFATTAISDFRTSSTATLTAGTRTLDATALSSVTWGVPATAATPLTPPASQYLLKQEVGEQPVQLATNEGVELQATVPATGTWVFSVKVCWDEVTAY